MRSYYTYGAIPDPVQTVRGYADGGLTKGPEVALAGAGGEDKPLVQQLYERGEISDAEYRAWLAQQAQEQAPLSTYPRPPDEMAGPSQEYNPVTRLPTIRSGLESAQPAPATDYGWKGDLESGKNVMDFFNLQREREFGPGALQSFAGPTGGGTPVQPGQFSLYNPNERSAAQVAADYAKASGLDLAGFAKSQGMSEAELMSQINKTEMDPTTQRGALNEIKSLAGAGDFQGAFEAAKAAEARIPGQDFVSTLVSPESLRYITPEMDKKDVDNYFDALKNVVGEKEYEQRYVGTGNEMSLDQAKERSMQAIDQGAGFVNPSLGVKAEETLLSKLPVEQAVKVAAALAAAYTVAPTMFGAGSVGAAPTAGAAAPTAGAATTGAATTGAATTAGTAGATSGGLTSAISNGISKLASIPYRVGDAVAQQLGLNITTKTGITALGNSIISGTTTAVRGGDIGDIIKSAALAAGVTYVSDAAIKALRPIVADAQDAFLGTTSKLAKDTATAAASGLDDVIVNAARDTIGNAVSTVGGAAAGLSYDPKTGDVTLEGKKVPVAGPESVGAVTGALSAPTTTTPPEVEPAVREERVIETSKTPQGDVTATGAVTGALNPVTGQPDITVEQSKVPQGDLKATGALADMLTKPLSEQPPPDIRKPLEEITVTGKSPADIIPSLSGLLPLSDIGVPKPTQPLGTESQIKKQIEELDPTAAPASTLSDLIKKYGTLENALKVLGALGAGSAMAGGTAGGTGGLGKYDTSGGASFGAGLTPVQFGRKQLSPDIDYYTYATRPEAKFFEYNTQLAQPTQPGPVVPTPVQPSGVITQAAGGYVDENMTGGLIGYAKGGDAKPERYVDGPGSGRDDKIPAMLSDGEYVIDAETLALLGDGSTKEGARRLDKFRAKIRQHKGRALSRGRISPNAKSPEKYMGGGLS